MVASGAGIRVQGLAQELFDLVTQLGPRVPRGRRRAGDLKEAEFLTLAILHRQEPQIVGDIQRQLGVLPAQMSRVIRSLEARDRPLIACRINPHDKRKIDVALTPEGLGAFHDYQGARVRTLATLLTRLPDAEVEDLGRIVTRLQSALDETQTEG